jgi:hypothetical protein
MDFHLYVVDQILNNNREGDCILLISSNNLNERGERWVFFFGEEGICVRYMIHSNHNEKETEKGEKDRPFNKQC